MKRFYEGWDVAKHGTSEGQPGIYGDLDLPEPAGTLSIPSNFASRFVQESTTGQMQTPIEESAAEEHSKP